MIFLFINLFVALAGGSIAEATGVAPQVRLPIAVSLQDKTEVAGDRIYLADVAKCEGHASVCDQAAGIDLGPAPQPGRTGFLNKQIVERQLAREWADVELTVAGPANARVVATGVEVDQEHVTQAIAAALDQMVGDSSQLRLVLTRVQLGRSLVRRPGDGRFEVLGLSNRARTEDWLRRQVVGSKVFQIRFIPADPAQVDFQFGVQAQVQMQHYCAVAADRLDRGDRLSKSVVEFAWVTQRMQGRQCLTKPKRYFGYQMTRRINAGDPVPRAALKKPHLVKRGDIVRIEISRGGMTVTGDVKALSNGGAGDVIRAQYPATRKQVKIRVTGPGRAKYVF